MKYIARCICSILIVVGIITLYMPQDVRANEESKKVIADIINWKKTMQDQSSSQPLLNYEFVGNAGTTAVDWYVLGLGRAGQPDNYSSYIAVINDVVTEKYKNEEKLSENKATEWHRIALAYLAAGGDPTAVGPQGINLIQDGIYDRGKVASIDVQGLNGAIWGLITLDSMRYKVPSNAYYSRDDLIKLIMKKQLKDGGFSLQSNTSEIDITAMAVQSLAPYYNNEKLYNGKSVRQVIDEALAFLAENQLDNGAFSTEGEENLESTAQVAVALTALGRDVEEDRRFIKEGKTVVDGMLTFKMADGGFIHSKKYNADNPTSLPDESNSMATEQALYAFTAVLRAEENARTLYDFRDEASNKAKEQIAQIEQQIEEIQTKQMAIEALHDYKELHVSEHSYVKNYYLLATALKRFKVKNDSQNLVLAMAQHSNGTMSAVQLLHDSNKQTARHLTKEELAKINHLPKEVSTKDYVEMTTLLSKVQDHQMNEKKILQKRKQQIEALQENIDRLNNEIVDELYPFTELSLKDEKIVKSIVKDYNELPHYDQQQIVSANDVEKSMQQIKTLKMERLIKYIVIAILVVAMTLFIVLRKRKQRKRAQQ